MVFVWEKKENSSVQPIDHWNGLRLKRNERFKYFPHINYNNNNKNLINSFFWVVNENQTKLFNDITDRFVVCTDFFSEKEQSSETFFRFFLRTLIKLINHINVEEF